MYPLGMWSKQISSEHSLFDLSQRLWLNRDPLKNCDSFSQWSSVLQPGSKNMQIWKQNFEYMNNSICQLNSKNEYVFHTFHTWYQWWPVYWHPFLGCIIIGFETNDRLLLMMPIISVIIPGVTNKMSSHSNLICGFITSSDSCDDVTICVFSKSCRAESLQTKSSFPTFLGHFAIIICTTPTIP